MNEYGPCSYELLMTCHVPFRSLRSVRLDHHLFNCHNDLWEIISIFPFYIQYFNILLHMKGRFWDNDNISRYISCLIISHFNDSPRILFGNCSVINVDFWDIAPPNCSDYMQWSGFLLTETFSVNHTRIPEFESLERGGYLHCWNWSD